MTDAERLSARDRLLDAWREGRHEREALRSDWNRVCRGLRHVERRLAHVMDCHADGCADCALEVAG